jgi:hypothetical protein
MLLLRRQEAVDRQLGKHVIREAICEHERLRAAVRAASQGTERPALLSVQLRHRNPIVAFQFHLFRSFQFGRVLVDIEDHLAPTAMAEDLERPDARSIGSNLYLISRRSTA